MVCKDEKQLLMIANCLNAASFWSRRKHLEGREEHLRTNIIDYSLIGRESTSD